MPVPELDEKERKQWGLDEAPAERDVTQDAKPHPLVGRVTVPVWALVIAGLLFVAALGDGTGGQQQLDAGVQRASTAEQRVEEVEQRASRLGSEYAQRKADLDAREAELDAREENLNGKNVAHPAPAPKAPAAERPAAKAPAAQPAPKSQPKQVSYANCTQAKAAGAAPLRRDEPGYAPHLDRDSDGVACE